MLWTWRLHTGRRKINHCMRPRSGRTSFKNAMKRRFTWLATYLDSIRLAKSANRGPYTLNGKKMRRTVWLNLPSLPPPRLQLNRTLGLLSARQGPCPYLFCTPVKTHTHQICYSGGHCWKTARRAQGPLVNDAHFSSLSFYTHFTRLHRV